MEADELRPQQRSARIAWQLAQGQRLRTVDAARLVGLSWQGTRALLCLLSEDLPIYQNEAHEWVWNTGRNSE